jgi:hypothetical protein
VRERNLENSEIINIVQHVLPLNRGENGDDIAHRRSTFKIPIYHQSRTAKARTIGCFSEVPYT